MSQIKEAIEKLEKANEQYLSYDKGNPSFLHPVVVKDCIDQALALLRAEAEKQKHFPEIWREWATNKLAEYTDTETNSEKRYARAILGLCNSIDCQARTIKGQTARITELEKAIQKAIPLIHHDNDCVGPSEIQSIKILEQPLKGE